MYALFVSLLFFFNDTATTEIYTLSLHDALPISTPKIKKVTPDEGRTGDKVTIAGEHFGEPGCVSMVSFGPGGAAKFTQVDDRTITVTVPDGKKGMELLTVTGFTGEDSKPFLRK